MTGSDLEVLIVAHGGPLEPKAAFLAASILRCEADAKVVICEPSGADPLTADGRAFFGALGVEVRPTHNPLAADYLIGNKLGAVAAASQPGALFLDSDILCLRPTLAELARLGTAAKPADANSARMRRDSWQQLFNGYELDGEPPEVIASFSKQPMVAFFNAGVLAFADAPTFAADWIEACEFVEEFDLVDEPYAKRPHLDQVGYTLAAVRSGIRVHELDNRHNFAAHWAPVTPQVGYAHYHGFDTMRADPALRDLARSLVREFDPPSSIVRSADPDDCWIHRRPHVSAAAELGGPSMIVTGLPRSGTSFLTSALGSLHGVVALNEPASVHGILRQWRPGLRLAAHYRQWRADVIDGVGIESKQQAGRVIEDTRLNDQLDTHSYGSTEAPFLLASKNPLAYLARLDAFIGDFASASIVACVRHPFETINSWGNSFPHLESVDLAKFPFGGLRDPQATPQYRDLLHRVDAETDPLRRRARLWAELAGWVADRQASLTILRYEDLTSDPEGELRKLVDLPVFLPERPIEARPSQPVTLVPEERVVIAEVCGAAARRLGYDL